MVSPAGISGPTPHETRVLMYQVGFGDCVLVLFNYRRPLPDGRRQRSMLIDFGSTHGPRGRRLDLAGVAARIGRDCGGKLDVIVVTHRHKDHLSGFGHAEAGAAIAGLRPDLVVRPWTEDPRLGADATGPLGAQSLHFAKGLAAAQSLAASLAAAVPADVRGLRSNLRRLALDELANQAAIARLDALAEAARGTYVFAGSPTGIEDVIPGVHVSALGPPTLEQDPRIGRAAATNPEFWMLYQSLIETGLPAAALSEAAPDDDDDEPLAIPASTDVPPGPARWLAERLRGDQIHSLFRVVRGVDAALNNTSLILLVESGRKRMLFPGDAQIENWRFTLDRLAEDRGLRERLSRVDLYKVGHHGSRNATPRSLFALWTTNRTAARPMTGLLSTRAGVHGSSEATAVPRSTLLSALRERMTLLSTDDDESPPEVVEVATPLRSARPFRIVDESDHQ